MKVKMNKHLRELGLTYKDLPCSGLEGCRQRKDKRHLPDRDGFVQKEFWNLDYTLSLVIYSYLKEFLDEYISGYPVGYKGIDSDEDWEKAVESMCEAFKIMILKPDGMGRSKAEIQKVNRGLKLFAQCFEALWW